MNFPGYLKRHSVTVEPFLGDTAYGPTYGPAVTVKCFRDDDQKLVKTPGGDEVNSVATLYCGLAENIPTNSRITLVPNGPTYSVIMTKVHDGGGLPTFDHLQVVL